MLGTRPEIMKLAPVIRECVDKGIKFFVIHTNQHFTENMSKVFFRELKLSMPKYNLGINSVDHGEMVGRILIKTEKILKKEKPDWVLVQGDTNTVMAGAFIAQRLGIKVGHIEAGQRSYDRSMPEEINRIVADHVSDILYCPTKLQASIVLKEGIDKKKVYVTGNTVVDSVIQSLTIAEKKQKYKHYEKENYFLLTLHRPSNVDDKVIFIRIIKTLEELAAKHGVTIYFPVHPRTKKQMRKHNIKINNNKIKIMDPVGYLEMLMIMKNARLILTDSGGLQEEACILRVPCVTLRDNTERPETLDVGSNILVGSSKRRIISGVERMLKIKKNWKQPFGNGKAAKKIVDIIANYE